MIDFSLYLKPFLVALAISLGLVILAIKTFGKILAAKQKRDEDRHVHDKTKSVCRVGGVAIIIAFVSAILLDDNLVITRNMWGFISGGILILAVGLVDDFKDLSWKIQLFFQTCIVSLIFIFGARITYITNPFGEAIQFDTSGKIFLGIIIGVVWSLVLMNSMNWLDGIDGLSGGVALIGAVTIFLLSLKPEVNQPPVGIISMALAGSLLGFLLMNFYPAKIMAGTSGAFFMGFILAGLSVFAGTKIATTLLVLSIPIIDFFWVIGRRIRLGKSIFEPDREHLHHRLLEIGWSQRKISLFFYAITILIAIAALNIGAVGKAAMIVLIVTLAISLFRIINDYKLMLSEK